MCMCLYTPTFIVNLVRWSYIQGWFSLHRAEKRQPHADTTSGGGDRQCCTVGTNSIKRAAEECFSRNQTNRKWVGGNKHIIFSSFPGDPLLTFVYVHQHWPPLCEGQKQFSPRWWVNFCNTDKILSRLEQGFPPNQLKTHPSGATMNQNCTDAQSPVCCHFSLAPVFVLITGDWEQLIKADILEKLVHNFLRI